MSPRSPLTISSTNLAADAVRASCSNADSDRLIGSSFVDLLIAFIAFSVSNLAIVTVGLADVTVAG